MHLQTKNLFFFKKITIIISFFDDNKLSIIKTLSSLPEREDFILSGHKDSLYKRFLQTRTCFLDLLRVHLIK